MHYTAEKPEGFTRECLMQQIISYSDQSGRSDLLIDEGITVANNFRKSYANCLVCENCISTGVYIICAD